MGKINYEITKIAVEESIDISSMHINNLVLEEIIKEIITSYNNTKTYLKFPEIIHSIFIKSNIDLNKRICRKITWALHSYRDLEELFCELRENTLLKDKIELHLKDFEIILKIHDNFIVKTDPTGTYINGKFFYDIEEQDLLESYCEFITSQQIYIQFKSRRIFHMFPQPLKYFKIYSRKKSIAGFKYNKKIDAIFNNKELIYKSN